MLRVLGPDVACRPYPLQELQEALVKQMDDILPALSTYLNDDNNTKLQCQTCRLIITLVELSMDTRGLVSQEAR